MSKLVQKVKWNLDGSNTEMYMYGEAGFEANKAMQEPLEKLYQYENQPDERKKIKEYVAELTAEIDRLQDELFIKSPYTTKYHHCRIGILQEVVNDLQKKYI